MTTSAPFVFVLMPLSKRFKDIYDVGIRPACKDAGAHCERVDEQIFRQNLLDRIYDQITKADFIVADMSGRNANVYYEVGYAHALGKPVILLTQRAKDIPFDLKHYHHIIYEGGISKLKNDLERTLKVFIKPSKELDPQVKRLLQVWSDRDRVRPSLRKRMQSAEKSLFLVGLSFESLYKDHREVLLEALKKGVTVRTLMLHPASKHVDAHQEFATRNVRESINTTVEYHLKSFYAKYKRLESAHKGQLNVRATYYLPRFAARIVDDKNMVLNLYLFNSKAHENPVIEICRDRHEQECETILTSLEELFDYGGESAAGHPNCRIIENGRWKGLPSVRR